MARDWTPSYAAEDPTARAGAQTTAAGPQAALAAIETRTTVDFVAPRREI